MTNQTKPDKVLLAWTITACICLLMMAYKLIKPFE
jgi:hypothetical protein